MGGGEPAFCSQTPKDQPSVPPGRPLQEGQGQRARLTGRDPVERVKVCSPGGTEQPRIPAPLCSTRSRSARPRPRGRLFGGEGAAAAARRAPSPFPLRKESLCKGSSPKCQPQAQRAEEGPPRALSRAARAGRRTGQCVRVPPPPSVNACSLVGEEARERETNTQREKGDC